MKRLVLVVHNVRSALNVGSILRTAEGFGVDEVYITGYSPYPEVKNDSRLPHHRQRTALQIHKTALGAEDFLKWHYISDIDKCLDDLGQSGFSIVALEQTKDSLWLDQFKPTKDVALIVGNEVDGLGKNVLRRVDKKIQIPMRGRKESFNVAVAAAIAIYRLRQATLPRQ